MTAGGRTQLHNQRFSGRCIAVALYFHTDDPKALLSHVKGEIESRSIRSWKLGPYGHFEHVRYRGARMRPKVQPQRLEFHIVITPDATQTQFLYAQFHATLLQLFLDHADALFTHATASATFYGEDEDRSRRRRRIR